MRSGTAPHFQVTIAVTRPAQALVVRAPNRLYLTGNGVVVSTSGLEPGERFTISVGGVQVLTGQASSTGDATRTATVPSRLRDGTATVTVTGSAADRTGSTRVRVVTNKTLGLALARRVVLRGHRQSVTVSGLASNERVTVRFRGRRVSPDNARAGALGNYRVTFLVGSRVGTHAVTATGRFVGRTAATTFWVVRRR